MKRLELDIKCCADCPYSARYVYSDVGVSFGMEFGCTKGAEQVRNPDNHSVEKMRGTIQERLMTKQETESQIRPDCPLPDKDSES